MGRFGRIFGVEVVGLSLEEEGDEGLARTVVWRKGVGLAGVVGEELEQTWWHGRSLSLVHPFQI